MSPERIEGESGLRAWLETQSREVAVTLAHRAAMRVAPLIWSEFALRVSEDRLTAIPVARALLISGVGGVFTGPVIKFAADSAIAAVDRAAAAVRNPRSARAIYEATAVLAAAGATAITNTTAAAAAAATAARSATASAAESTAAAVAAVRTAVESDSIELDGLTNGHAVLGRQLWLQGRNPLSKQWESVRSDWRANGPGWQFWIDWYEAALEGRPLLGDWDRHWDLLTEIALIPDAEWNVGPERVNTLIELILEKHRLQAEAARLRAELIRQEAAFASVARRSHNQPPELVEVPIVHQYRVAIGALAEVEDELAKPAPSPTRLVRVAETLRDWAGKTLTYCAKLGDAALMELAKAVGKVAAPGVVFWLVAQSEHIQTLADAVQNLAARLPSGFP